MYLLGNEMFIIDWDTDFFMWLFRLVVAALCGLAVGLERTARSKEAGMRTHTIVCFAAALIMIVSKYAFVDLVGDLAVGVREADAARIAAQAVSGIGFLGAGIIFYKRDLLHGLTTAAGVWATAGIGLAIGAGMVITGVVATAILLATQILLHKSVKFVRKNDHCLLRIVAKANDAATLDKIKEVLKVKRVERFKTIQTDNGPRVEIDAICLDSWEPNELFNAVKDLEYIQSVEKLEES